MKPIQSTVQICTVLMSFASAQVCFGQLGTQNNRSYDPPTFSPYINLLRNNGGVGQNYYGLVRPQMDFAQQNQQLNQGLQQLQMQNPNQLGRSPGGYGYSQLGVTGHPVIFNSFGNGQFSGGYTGVASGGLGGGSGGFGGGGGGNGIGGMQGGSQFGQMGMGGVGMTGASGTGFSGVTGFAPQFGGIGNTYRGSGR